MYPSTIFFFETYPNFVLVFWILGRGPKPIMGLQFVLQFLQQCVHILATVIKLRQLATHLLQALDLLI